MPRWTLTGFLFSLKVACPNCPRRRKNFQSSATRSIRPSKPLGESYQPPSKSHVPPSRGGCGGAAGGRVAVGARRVAVARGAAVALDEPGVAVVVGVSVGTRVAVTVLVGMIIRAKVGRRVSVGTGVGSGVRHPIKALIHSTSRDKKASERVLRNTLTPSARIRGWQISTSLLCKAAMCQSANSRAQPLPLRFVRRRAATYSTTAQQVPSRPDKHLP